MAPAASEATPAGTPPRAWYAAYGSNCDAARLRCYLAGGWHEPSQRTYPGSRDPRPPSAWLPLTLPHAVRFAGWSAGWGGTASARLDDTTADVALARAWLLSWPQLEDVWAQENGVEPAGFALAQADAGETLVEAPYGRLLRLGSRAGTPIVSFTAPDPRAEPAGAPSPAYLGCVVAGLAATYRLNADALADYVTGLEGVAAGWSRGDVRRLCVRAIAGATGGA